MQIISFPVCCLPQFRLNSAMVRLPTRCDRYAPIYLPPLDLGGFLGFGLGKTMRTESEPMICMPSVVCPFRIPIASPGLNPVSRGLNWPTKSNIPSPFTSTTKGLRARLVSSPVRPKVSDLRSTTVGASKLGVERMATEIRSPELNLMVLGNLPGLISMVICLDCGWSSRL